MTKAGRASGKVLSEDSLSRAAGHGPTDSTRDFQADCYNRISLGHNLTASRPGSAAGRSMIHALRRLSPVPPPREACPAHSGGLSTGLSRKRDQKKSCAAAVHLRRGRTPMRPVASLRVFFFHPCSKRLINHHDSCRAGPPPVEFRGGRSTSRLSSVGLGHGAGPSRFLERTLKVPPRGRM